MEDYSPAHCRKLWMEALLQANFTHSSVMKTMEYLRTAKTLEEDGKKSMELFNLLMKYPEEEEFVKNLATICLGHGIE